MMMEKLGAPQTHIGLKNMIREVDEDYDGKLSYREVGVCVSRLQQLFVENLWESELDSNSNRFLPLGLDEQCM